MVAGCRLRVNQATIEAALHVKRTGSELRLIRRVVEQMKVGLQIST
jgi:hypothetical protein